MSLAVLSNAPVDDETFGVDLPYYLKSVLFKKLKSVKKWVSQKQVPKNLLSLKNQILKIRVHLVNFQNKISSIFLFKVK